MKYAPAYPASRNTMVSAALLSALWRATCHLSGTQR